MEKKKWAQQTALEREAWEKGHPEEAAARTKWESKHADDAQNVQQWEAGEAQERLKWELANPEEAKQRLAWELAHSVKASNSSKSKSAKVGSKNTKVGKPLGTFHRSHKFKSKAWWSKAAGAAPPNQTSAELNTTTAVPTTTEASSWSWLPLLLNWTSLLNSTTAAPGVSGPPGAGVRVSEAAPGSATMNATAPPGDNTTATTATDQTKMINSKGAVTAICVGGLVTLIFLAAVYCLLRRRSTTAEDPVSARASRSYRKPRQEGDAGTESAAAPLAENAAPPPATPAGGGYGARRAASKAAGGQDEASF